MANAAPPVDRDLPSSAGRRGHDVSFLARTYARLLADAGIEVDGARPWDMLVHDRRLWQRLLRHGTLGLGEAYVEGWWDVAQLDEFFARLIRASVDRRVFNLPKRLLDTIAALGNLQNPRRAQQVAEKHYNLGNALYRAMLGSRMVYTCAYWPRATTLEVAQDDKLELVCRKLELEPDMRVLDIGCGWGGFARYAAERHGVSVVGVTIAEDQATLARELCAGLPVDIRVQDYRDVRGQFDRIVSLGMFEHVGRKNYRDYMQQLRRLLTRDGLCVLQTIGLNESGSGIDPWVTRYIFPNSEIPTIARLATALEDGLKVEDWHNFGLDYARTLRAWHANFSAAWPEFAHDLGTRFYRMWTYYLLMFAGVFAGRGLDLWQLVLSTGGRAGAYRRPLL